MPYTTIYLTPNTTGPNERRCITRQDIGHQRKLIIGAIYTSTSATHNSVLSLKHGKTPFYHALKFCIDTHPLLSTVILNASTEVPEFATPKLLDLDKHLEIVESEDVDEKQAIEKLMARISDEKFEALHTTPPWKVVLAPLPSDKVSGAARLLVLFTSFHSHGDGRSGLAFQNSFLAGLSKYIPEVHDKESAAEDMMYKPPTTELLPPIEEGGIMTLSWSYLLSPLLGTYLPKSVSSFLGLRDSWLSSDLDIWRGAPTTFDPENHSTGLKLITLDSATKDRLLQQCRRNNSTFTGILQHLIARSLTSPSGGAIGSSSFVAGVAIDMRHLFPGIYSTASMMNCVTGYNELITYSPSSEPHDWATNSSSPFWEAARKTSKSLKVASGTLHNQPIGLLQYLKAFRPWTKGLEGKERDMSFEISNLGAFKSESREVVKIEKAVFSQPAKVSGSLLDFNVVSTPEGPLVITVTWQRGVLGLDEGIEEDAFVKRVCAKLEESFIEIANSE